MASPDTPRESAARVFFALWPDEATARSLFRLSAEAHAACKGRRMRRDTIHLTLAFIGDVAHERLPQLMAVGDRVVPAAFTLRLDRIAGWRHNRIVWAGTDSTPEPLTGLVEYLNAALAEAGFPVEQRKFAPHVTLLRKAEGELPRGEIAPPIDWQVRSFSLMESVRSHEGAQYVPLRTWIAT
ncbi:RNA 2',3'-cyclic phosphodiesterase [Azoarcus sp. KH32C]|uniref:RNA 2',3'-cyclic phosphodiesterase n=1 Tax=Azoarcus sp. KH32C TaxID=748247 RepID=UPI0002386020|nr:RNA 2',3'-cyclic phosphodiesterase [Azoarcus sp. KH32C]BAL25066.1 2'-5' RNA ligase [Azoarcus sp. KH32C]